jgi:outer membrane protein assembly factor BamB
LAVGVVAGSVTNLSAADWTQFRGPAFGTTSETGLPTSWTNDHIVWKTPLVGRGASSPVTFGDRVYLTAYSGYGLSAEDPGDPADLVRHVFCINLQDGQVLWTKELPAPNERNEFNNWAVALHGFASSTPAVDETGVYIFFGVAGVMAFTHDGALQWETSLGTGTHVFGTGNSPLLHGDLVIVNASVECGDLIALRKADGSEAWRQSGMVQSWSTPVLYRSVSGKTELAVTIQDKVLAFDPASGNPLWNCAGISDYICPSIVVHDGVLFASGARASKMLAIRSGGTGDITESHKLWDVSKGSNVSSPVYHDGYLYWAKEKSGILYCAKADTGEIVYEERLTPDPGLIYASPLLADGMIYYVSRESGVYVLPAKPEFKILAHNKLEDDDSIFNASPVPVGKGQFLLRSDKHLYRIGSK